MGTLYKRSTYYIQIYIRTLVNDMYIYIYSIYIYHVIYIYAKYAHMSFENYLCLYVSSIQFTYRRHMCYIL